MTRFRNLVETALYGKKPVTIPMPGHLTDQYTDRLTVINPNDLFWGTDLDDESPQFDPFYKHIYLVGNVYGWLYLINAKNGQDAIDELVDYYEIHKPQALLSPKEENEIRQENEEYLEDYLYSSYTGRYIADMDMNHNTNFKEVESDTELTAVLLDYWIKHN